MKLIMNKTDFKTSNYFSWHVYYSGFLFIAFGLASLTIHPIIGLILCFSGLIFVTTHYRLAVDLGNKAYHDYIWFLGFRRGEKGKFKAIEYLFIKRSSVNQTMHLRVASSTIRKEVFDGYLKFSEQDKIHLLTMDSKERLIKKLKHISTLLKVSVVDYSEGDARQI